MDMRISGRPISERRKMDVLGVDGVLFDTLFRRNVTYYAWTWGVQLDSIVGELCRRARTVCVGGEGGRSGGPSMGRY